MRADDLLEWAAAGCFCAAAYLFVGLTLTLVVGGVCLAYFAQCYHAPLPKPRLPKIRLRRHKAAVGRR